MAFAPQSTEDEALTKLAVEVRDDVFAALTEVKV